MTATDPRPATPETAPMSLSPAGPDSLNGQPKCDAHVHTAVEGQTSPQAISGTAPSPKSPAGSTKTTRPTIVPAAPEDEPSAGISTLSGHKPSDTHFTCAAEGQDSPQARDPTQPNGTSPAGSTAAPPARHQTTPIRAPLEGCETSRSHDANEAHASLAAAADTPGRQKGRGNQRAVAAGGQGPPAVNPESASRALALLADPLLALAADVLDDLEKVRIANENRLRQLTRTGLDADGLERGFGLDETHPDVARLAALVGMLAQAEHKAMLNLQRVMRKHPLGPWVKATTGIGEKQGARLIAAIGDPYWNTLYDRPRLVGELWAYCGYHVVPVGQGVPDTHAKRVDGEPNGSGPGQGGPGTHAAAAGVAPKRQRGQRANWSATAKMRAFLAAESCMKQRGSPYRAVYDAARVKYAEALHDSECARCGPRNDPAKPGSPLSEGHRNARALRAVAKEILRDLWREARAIHEGAQ